MKIFYPIVLIMALIFSMPKPFRGGFHSPGPEDTIRVKFVPFPFSDNAKIKTEILRRLNKDALDGEKYYDLHIRQTGKAGIKILNVYGEVTGGATYNPFALSYILKNNMTTETGLGGEIFRVDSLENGNFLLYFDNYWRLGSNFSVYETSISNNEIVGYKTNKHGNYIYDCIISKTAYADSLPIGVPKKRFDDNLMELLALDTMQLAVNSYYWRDDSPFLYRLSSDENDYIEPYVFYRHTNGDILEKILRIGYGKNAIARTLAMRADDPFERMSTEFINDSIFREYYMAKETAEDLQDFMAYEIDSVVTDYKYDKRFNFTKVGERKFHYRTERFMRDGDPVTRRITLGDTMMLNGIRMQEKFGLDKQRGALPVLYYVLLNLKTRQEILHAGRHFYIGHAPETDDFDAYLEDVNLDGYKDFKIHNLAASGSAGNWEDVFIFNPKTKKFDKSELFSGFDIDINTVDKVVTLYGRSGGFDFRIEKIHLGKKSAVRFTEGFSCTYKDEMLILQYSKYKKGKKVAEKTRTFPIGEHSQEEVREMLLEMAK